jgi:hypothetical protein
MSPMAQLFLVVYGLFALATPVLVIALYVRYSRLQARVKAAEEESARQATQTAALRHEIADLKKQVTAQKTPAADKAITQERVPIPAPLYETITEHPKPETRSVAMPPATTTPPKPSPSPAPPTEPKKLEIPPIVPVASPPTQSLPLPQKEEPKPQLPSTPAATEPPKPTTPPPPPVPLAPPITPPLPIPPAPPKPPAVVLPAAASSSADVKPATPPVAARVVVPSPHSPLRVPAAKPTLHERMKKVSAFEEALGTNWLLKLGIVLLVLGVALFGIYELAALGNFGKVLVSYLVGGALLSGGIFLEKRERYQLLGRTGIGGGWALLFFSTYAMYHVAAMHVLDSLVLDSALMLLVAAAMAVHTLRYRSQFVTGLAFLLGYTTVALSHDTVYSLSAGVILAIGLVSMVLKMRWYELEVFGILSSYLNHLYWLYRILGIQGAHGHAFPEYRASTAMLLFYWATFRVSYVLRRTAGDQEEGVSTAAAVLNTLLLLGSMRFQSVQPELAYLALLVVGALEFACSLLPSVRHRRQAFVVLSVMGAALMLASVPFHYSGNNVAILWLVGTEVFLMAGIVAKEGVFRRIGLLTGFLVGAHLFCSDFRSVLNVRLSHELPLMRAAALFGLCAVVFYLNTLGIGRKWREFFCISPDRELLTSHSYLGVLSAAVAAWAFFTNDWTAVAFAVLMFALGALGYGLQSQHLQAQYLFLGALTAYRTFVFNLHLESPDGVHVKMRLVTLPLLATVFYATAKLSTLRDTFEQRVIRGCLAAAGTSVLALLIWFETPELWRPVAFIAFAVALAESGRALKYPVLAWHTHLVCLLAGATTLIADVNSLHRWHTLPVHSFSGLAVVAGYYWLAWRGTKEADHHLTVTRAAYTWAAAALMLWGLFELVRGPWIAVAWIAFAMALVLVARSMSYEQLAWQANVVAVCATLRTMDANYLLEQRIWPGIGLRIATVSLVAAGLYFLSRRGAPNESLRRWTAFFHSFVATGLLSALMYYEAPNGWLAPLWAGFALLLALIDRKWQCEELPWQAHILALLTLMRVFTLNLYLTATWHNWSVRLLSLSLVAVIFYAMARIVRMPDEWRDRDIHHVYSWAASVIASLLLWYELQPQPLSLAVAWAAFGLILFEYGLLRKVAQFRYQAYIALIAAFTRIFFVNLTAGAPGEFWGPRIYTISPIILILFFVYAQLPESASSREESEEIARDRAWHVDSLIACFGTAAIVALLRFQFIGEWVVTAWAALVLLLFAVSLLLNRQLFLYQGMLLTLLTFARGVAHNLFGSGYFAEGDWKGRYVVLSAAVGLMLASLAFAFPLRGRFSAPKNASTLERSFYAMVRRPEQLQFFAPILLLSLMLALKMRAGMVTVSWGIEGLLIIVLALLLSERSFRLAGLGLLLLCVGKIMAMDVWALQVRDRYLTLIIVGSALILVSYLYSRYREAIRQFL